MPTAPSLSPVAEIARRHDPDRFFCALFAPVERREALFALIAFNHELARAREVATNPMTVLIRLQWWRDSLEEARAGKPPRRHEVAAPLHTAIREGALDPDDLVVMADAREAEAEDAVPTREALLAYLRGTAGGVAVASGRLLGASGASLAGLQALGAAYGMTGVLRSVPALAAQGRCLLPADLLAAQGLTPEAAVRDPKAKGVASVGAALAEDAARLLAEGRSLIGALPRSILSAALPAVLARRDLGRLRRASNLADPRLARPRSLGDRMAVLLAVLHRRI